MRTPRRSPVKWFVDNFFKGCLLLVPVATTVWVVWSVFVALDRLLPSPVPGLGIAIAAVVIALIGFATSNVLGRRLIFTFESILERLPIVHLVYASLKDLIDAFVGNKKTFERPVLVKLDDQGGVGVLGFVTCDHFDDPALAGYVAVYLPQSYNFAGNLIVVPAGRVTPVATDGAAFVTFIVSGGISGMNAAKKYLEETAPISRRP
jgi:uncharacterized membrane protein